MYSYRLLRNRIADALAKITAEMMALDWSVALSRDDLRHRIPQLPPIIYLHLPATKRFNSPDDVRLALWASLHRLHDEDGILVDEAQVMDNGGPPTWGPDPLLGGKTQESGSAMDQFGLDASIDANSDLSEQ